MSSSADLVGSFGLEANLTGHTDAVFVQDDSLAAETLVTARFYLDPNTYTPGIDGERLKIFQLFSTSPEQRRLVTVVLRAFGGGDYRLLAKVREDDDTLLNTGFHSISDGPHVVEFEWQAGAGSGRLDFYVDDVLVSSLTGLDNDARPAEFVRLGALGIKENTIGSIHLDAFHTRRECHIGLEP